MNMYFRSFLASASFFLTHSVCAMDQQKALVQTNPGVFKKFDNHKEARDVLFGSFGPKGWNALRKTCKQFSEYFSFCNPSTEFILCKNMNMHKKDMQSIFFTAVYDGNHEIAGAFSNNQKISRRYKIMGTSYALYPHLIAQANRDEKMSLLLKHLEGTELQKSKDGECFDSYSANPLLIACVSRNRERLHRALIDPKVILQQSMVLLALLVLVDNGDTESLAVMFDNEKMRNYIKENGTPLISQAILSGNKKFCEILLASKIIDLNKETCLTPVLASDNCSDIPLQLVEKAYSNSLCTLLDDFLGEESFYNEFFGQNFVKEIKEMLIKNGAKTSEQLKDEMT